jgi:hypothetical protein
MNWGQFTALSLDPRMRLSNLGRMFVPAKKKSYGMSKSEAKAFKRDVKSGVFLAPPLATMSPKGIQSHSITDWSFLTDLTRTGIPVGLSGLGSSKPWKKMGVTKAEYKEQRGVLTEQAVQQYSTTSTKKDLKTEIKKLQEEKSAASGAEKAKIKQELQALKHAKSTLKAQGTFYKPSATSLAPAPDEPGPGDLTPAPGPSPAPAPTPGPVITDGNDYIGVPPGETPYPITAITPSGPSISITDGGGGSLPTYGSTMWDTVREVTGGNTNLLLMGAAALGLFLLLRRKK